MTHVNLLYFFVLTFFLVAGIGLAQGTNTADRIKTYRTNEISNENACYKITESSPSWHDALNTLLISAGTQLADGDTIMFVTDGGEYWAKDTWGPKVDLVVMAAPALKIKPHIVQDGGYFWEMNSGKSLSIKGLTLDALWDQDPNNTENTYRFLYVRTGIKYLEVDNCNFFNLRGNAIALKGKVDTLLVSNCNFYDNGNAGIYSKNEDNGDVRIARVSNCSFWNTNSKISDKRQGILLKDNKGAIEISHCNFYGNVPKGVELTGSDISVSIMDNIFVGHDEAAVISNDPNSIVEYNLFYDNGIDISASGSVIAGNLYTDPLFADQNISNPDFGLNPDSPAINAASDNKNMGDLRWGIRGPLAPVITSPSEVHAYWDQYFIYKATVDNPDELPLDLFFEDLPHWLVSDVDSVFGTPLESDLDTNFTVIASSDTFSDTLIVEVNVHSEPNQRPEITSPGAVNAIEDEIFIYRASANDPDGPNLTWIFQEYPNWLTTGIDSIYGIPTEGITDASFRVIASDGLLFDTLQVLITIQSVNDPPNITSSTFIYPEINNYFRYQATAKDPDGPTLLWIFKNLPVWLNSDADSAYGTPPTGALDTSFRIIVSDGFLSDSLDIKIIFGSRPWKWIAFGDTRNNKPAHRQVLEAIMANSPDYEFIINVGDVVDHGDIESEWVDWYSTTTSVLGDLGQDQAPPKYMATPGNHDATETLDGLLNWNKYLPGQEQLYGNEGKFFTFDYENARFIVMDSDKSSKTGAQLTMMMDAIQNNPETWLFVITHRPIFDFGEYSYNDNIHDAWGIPLYQHGCDIIFNGHNHLYLRTKKLELNGNINPPLDPDYGTMQIIASNGGASLDEPEINKDNNEYLVDSYIKEFGYTELNIEGDSLYLRHILRDGTVFEEQVFTPNPKMISGLTENEIGLNSVPSTDQLFQNFPNPFNPSTIISFDIQNPEFVMLKVYDINGREIKTLLKGYLDSGHYEISFTSQNSKGQILPSGVFFYRLQAGTFVETRKMLLLQ